MIVAAENFKSLDVSDCGLDWFLPVPLVARLPLLQELRCIDTSTLRLPPAQVCSGGLEAINKFFLNPVLKELEWAAVATASGLDSSKFRDRKSVV